MAPAAGWRLSGRVVLELGDLLAQALQFGPLVVGQVIFLRGRRPGRGRGRLRLTRGCFRAGRGRLSIGGAWLVSGPAEGAFTLRRRREAHS